MTHAGDWTLLTDMAMHLFRSCGIRVSASGKRIRWRGSARLPDILALYDLTELRRAAYEARDLLEPART